MDKHLMININSKTLFSNLLFNWMENIFIKTKQIQDDCNNETSNKKNIIKYNYN